MPDLISPIQPPVMLPKKPSHHRLLWSALIALVIVVVLVVAAMIADYQKNKKFVEDSAKNAAAKAETEKKIAPIRDGAMILSANKTQVSVGDELEVKILVNTKGANIVLADAIINFDSSKLALVGQPNFEDSVFKMDVISDSKKGLIEIIRGNTGDADYLDDGKTNGYTGENGLLAILKFKALQTGSAAVTLSAEKSSLILDDGRGTQMNLDFKDLNIEIVK